MVRASRRSRRTAAAFVWSVVALFVTSPSYSAEVVFLPGESEWRYLPGLAEASSPDATAWRKSEFSDAEWSTGDAPFGYGRNPPYATDLSELEPPMRGNYSTLFLRRKFTVPDADALVEFHARVTFDDGFILWLNGKEALRANVPDGELPFNETAERSHSPTAIEDMEVENPKDFLVTGENVVAVQMFNVSLGSSDLKFDLELFDPFGPDLLPPEIVRTTPAGGSTVRKLTRAEVVFNEPVAGVDAEDLLIEGTPALALNGGGTEYEFLFRTPDPGPIEFSWRADHGIVDLAPAQNSFGGGSWTANFDPDAPLPNLVITEFLAANGTGLQDDDGDEEDWIEIANESTVAVDLIGWSLTDDTSRPSKWVFPSVVVGPNEHVIVFASGKDRQSEDGTLHASFKLGLQGEEIALYSAEFPRDLVDWVPAYPEQRFDFSYGATDKGDSAYFADPTPGETNSGAMPFAGFTADPEFSVERGVYTEAFTLELASATAGAEIRFTTDGSEPTAESDLYSGPTEITPTGGRGLVAVRALALAADLLPSRTITHSYIFPREVLLQTRDPEGFPIRWGTQQADYELDPDVIESDPTMAEDAVKNVPTLSIVSDMANIFDARTGFYANPSQAGVRWERPVSAEFIFPDGRHTQVDCGIRAQGGSSTRDWKSRKVSMRLLFKGDYGASKLEFPLYPDYDVDRFDTLVLDAGLNLTLNHPDHGQRIQSQYVRDQYISDLQIETGGHAPRGVFVNLYLNGVHWGLYGIHERADASWAAENRGGSKDEYDAMRHQSSNVVDGDARAYGELLARSRAVRGDNLDSFLAAAEIIDLPLFADYMIFNHWAGNTDWAHQNWYATRARDGGKWLFHNWDAEHVLKSPGENNLSRSDSGGPTEVFQSLMRNAEFKQIYADRVQRHVSPGGALYVDPEAPEWDPENPARNRAAEIYMRRIEEINSLILLEYARWGDNRRAQTYVRADWERELTRLLRTYFPVRTRTVLNQLRSRRFYPAIPAPELNAPGGEVEAGFQLTMSLPDDAVLPVHYTLDGSDPRVFGTNELSPSAMEYAGPIAIDDFTHVKARTLDGAEWSALREAIFTIEGSSPATLEITEIMYNSAAGDEYDFLEIHNPSERTIDLAELEFTSGIRLEFAAGDAIGPGEYLVLAENAEAFAELYPDVPVFAQYSGALDGGGEKVTIKDGSGATIVSVDYNDGNFWEIGADGFGYSLVLADPEMNPDDPRAWRASTNVGGSPGAVDPARSIGRIAINEVAPHQDLIELVNEGSTRVDLTGWFLSDDATSAESLLHYQISGSIAPGEILAVDIPVKAFDVSPLGGAVYLASADAGELTGFVTGLTYPGAPFERSFGQHETSSRLELALMTPSIGEENPLPAPPEIAINEIQYHPLDGEPEFIELFNPGRNVVDLAGWRIAGISSPIGDAFIFPAGAEISAGGYLVVVNVDPNDFDANGATVVGPFGGALDNQGERIRLLRPAAAGELPVVLVDAVRFNDREPWPLEADGTGATLERISAGRYGSEALSWAASMAIGGTPGAKNSASETGEGGLQLPGDLSQDGRFSVTDPILILGHLFRGSPAELPCEGGTINDEGNRMLIDVNGDASVNVADAVALLNYIFRDGASHVLGRECVQLPGCPDVCVR